MKILNSKYANIKYEGKNLFSSNILVFIETIVNSTYNNVLPFISGAMLIKTGNIVWITLFLIPAIFTLDFKIVKK